MKLAPGDLIDEKYRVVGLLGQGGMGCVYAADNVRIDRRVAIKVLHRISGANDIARFEREARAVQLGSPHIVQVYDLGDLPDGNPYMVMEYLSGESLAQRILRRQRLEPSELLPIAEQLLEGLAVAHRIGIVHRDLKPDNVFLAEVAGSDLELVKILDFGISKFIDTRTPEGATPLTSVGVAVGTPHYMSPEQVQGLKELDTRTDLYSVGVILYQCLSGRLPFATEDVVALLSRILVESPEPLTAIAPDCDPALSAIVERAMAKNVDERYQSAHELREALCAFRAGRGRVSATASTILVAPIPTAPSRPRAARHSPLGWLLVAAGALALVGGAAAVVAADPASEAVPDESSTAERKEPPAALVPTPAVAPPSVGDAGALAAASPNTPTVQRLAEGISLVVPATRATPSLSGSAQPSLSESAQPSERGTARAPAAPKIAGPLRPPSARSAVPRASSTAAAEGATSPSIRQLSR